MKEFEYSFSAPPIPKWMEKAEWEESREYELRKYLGKENVCSVSFAEGTMGLVVGHALTKCQVDTITCYGFRSMKRLR